MERGPGASRSGPACWTALGLRPPKWSDICPGDDKWPLHSKPVGRVDLEEIANLQTSAHLADRWRRVKRWLTDDDAYDKVPIRTSAGCPTCEFTQEELEGLMAHDTVERTRPSDVRGHVKVFPRPEPAKTRRRVIKHTKDVNDFLGRETLEGVKMPLIAEICGIVHAGSHMLAFDQAAWFDQFSLGDRVRSRCCFRDRNGRYYRQCTLAMGQRQAVDVAHTATEILQTFDDRQTTALAIVDNSLFVGTRDQCVRDGSRFIERAKKVGATLNEDTTTYETLIVEEGDWGGVHLNLRNKTVCCTTKIVDKTRVSWSHRDQWTWRTFAAHIGLLFFARSIIETPVSDFFPLLRFISETGKVLTEHPERWDHRAVIWPSAAASMQRWTELILGNSPRRVLETGDPEILVMTDASSWGWGYIALNTHTGKLHRHGAPWSSAMRQRYGSLLKTSVFTEPRAIVNALCHLLRPGMPRRVRVGSDSSVSVATGNRGFCSRSYNLNQAAKRLNDSFGGRYTIDYVHVPGIVNTFADAESRGLATAAIDANLAEEVLRRWVG